MEMSDRGSLEYRGGEERLKILQNRKCFIGPVKHFLFWSIFNLSSEKKGVEWEPGGTREVGLQGAEFSRESYSSGRGNGVGWRPRSLLRSKDNILPEPRPLLARWFRRSLSICSSVNYPVLPPACPLWWQPEQLSRNSICSPVLLPSIAHQHFRAERCPISLGLGNGSWVCPSVELASSTHSTNTHK